MSGRLLKRISAHADLRSKLGDAHQATPDLDALLVREVSLLRERGEYRLTRKLNGGNVAALVIVAIVGGLVVYALVSWGLALAAWPPLAVLVFMLAAVAAFFAIALAAVGMRTLYQPARAK